MRRAAGLGVVAAATRRLPERYPGRGAVLTGLERAALRCPPGTLVEAPMRFGHRMVVDLRAGAQWRAFFTGRYDDRLLAVASRLLDAPGAVALDVGANVGFWTVPLARWAARRSGHVHAVEPVPANRRRLQENLRRNGVDGVVTVVPAVLSDADGEVELSLREDFEAGSGTGNAAVVIDDGEDGRFRRLVVPATTLDALAARLAVDRIDVLKADVEGHEDRLLAGGAATVERLRPVVVLEWNAVYYERRRVDPTPVVGALLRRWRYAAFRRSPSRRWAPADGFWSPRPVDDLVLAPDERADEVLALLAAR